MKTDDAGPRPESIGAIRRGQNLAAIQEMGAANVVEIIGMVFVAKKDGIDGGDLIRL